MNLYTAFYKDKEIQVEAKTSLAARDKAAKLLKARQTHKVTVVLTAKNGQEVTHIADF